MIELYTSSLKTPIGKMLICSTGKGICLLEFANDVSIDRNAEALASKIGADVLNHENGIIKQAKLQLQEYFAGKRNEFSFELNMIGTAFQKKVWSSLLKIPFGTTTTYLKQSRVVGDEKAIRAVASANGKNKIAIVIPCHRIIGSNGELTGYAGGIDKKKWLLEFEREQNMNSEQLKIY
ncbi:MAG: methylated-DNA--[protein]-cysteine S-methyltransferase [Bacteroidetes bacterium]|nr:methylated-DNA--[protein]-cysteine S-methyltransferase [Bacteroidota bacterium]